MRLTNQLFLKIAPFKGDILESQRFKPLNVSYNWEHVLSTDTVGLKYNNQKIANVSLGKSFNALEQTRILEKKN